MTDAGLERLANGVLWPGFLGTSAPDWLRRELDQGLAGAVLFGHNLAGDGRPIEPREGVLVGIDEEGGAVTRLEAEAGSTMPGAGQLGAADLSESTRRVAMTLGLRAADAGANLVAAPVADVNVNPANPVIGTRSFGGDAALVARHVAAAVRGLADAGVVACAKHFPGHGDTAIDSHHGLPVLAADPDALERVHLAPFLAAIAAGAPAIMTGHLVVPAWDELPATLSARALARLRGLGFDGAIVSDALDMAAVAARFGTPGAAVRALAAGCDLLCIGNPRNPGSSGDDERDLLAVRDAVVSAVEDGALPRARLEDAAARVRALATAPRAVDESRSPADAELADRIVRAATRVDGRLVPMPGPRTVVDARGAASWAVSAPRGPIATIVAEGGEVVDAAPTDAAGPLVVLVDRLADALQRAVVDGIVARGIPAVVVNLGVAPGEPGPLPTIHVGAASRLAALAAARILTEGRP